jgi:hypothetical protein
MKRHRIPEAEPFDFWNISSGRRLRKRPSYFFLSSSSNRGLSRPSRTDFTIRSSSAGTPQTHAHE